MDEENSEVLNKFFVSVSNIGPCSHTSGAGGQQDGEWEHL